jgi:hypothetical protein
MGCGPGGEETARIGRGGVWHNGVAVRHQPRMPRASECLVVQLHVPGRVQSERISCLSGVRGHRTRPSEHGSRLTGAGREVADLVRQLRVQRVIREPHYYVVRRGITRGLLMAVTGSVGRTVVWRFCRRSITAI